jgi:hypothetical protein
MSGSDSRLRFDWPAARKKSCLSGCGSLVFAIPALKCRREELHWEILGDNDKFSPDIVLICTPPVYNLEDERAPLQARAHVFVEKP